MTNFSFLHNANAQKHYIPFQPRTWLENELCLKAKYKLIFDNVLKNFIRKDKEDSHYEHKTKEE